MDRWYRLAYLCPICGKVPGVSRQRHTDPGLDVSGTAAELYPTGDLTWSVADLMRDSVSCETTGEYVKLNDPARLQIEPWPTFLIVDLGYNAWGNDGCNTSRRRQIDP